MSPSMIIFSKLQGKKFLVLSGLHVTVFNFVFSSRAKYIDSNICLFSFELRLRF
jgi:hypothetical protein